MNQDLQQKLFNKYPKIFKINKPAKKPFDFWKIEVWDGWFYLISETCNKIQKILNKDNKAFFNTAQLKQKFSSLRWYFDCDEKYFKEYNKIINNAEEESFKICEKCGTKNNVTQNKEGYILTLCDECRNKKDLRE
jgi:hypothetical protein